MRINVCKRCGKEFESSRVKSCCPDCEVGTCIICGKEFSRVGKDPKQECCSRQCSAKYRAETGQAKEAAKKILSTKLQKYGTTSGQGRKVRVLNCKFCGKEFTTTSTRKIYCDGPHYGACPICGKPSKITDLATGFVPTCSEECRQEKIRRTNQAKYGVDCYFQSEDHHVKAKATNLEKYGVDHYSKTEEYQQKREATLLKRYGVTVPLHSEEIAEKLRNTNIERYGVPYPLLNEDVRKKSLDTFDRK